MLTKLIFHGTPWKCVYMLHQKKVLVHIKSRGVGQKVPKKYKFNEYGWLFRSHQKEYKWTGKNKQFTLIKAKIFPRKLGSTFIHCFQKRQSCLYILRNKALPPVGLLTLVAQRRLFHNLSLSGTGIEKSYPSQVLCILL